LSAHSDFDESREKITYILRDDLGTLMVLLLPRRTQQKPIPVSECGYELRTPRMRRVLTNRYSFLTADLEDLVRKCIAKAGIVDRIYNSKCRSVLLRVGTHL
jgi:hypothetical protein